MTDQLENGLNILRAEARGARGKDRNWKHHNSLMRRAQRHVEFCGGYWGDYAGQLSREFAQLMRI